MSLSNKVVISLGLWTEHMLQKFTSLTHEMESRPCILPNHSVSRPGSLASSFC